MMSGDTAQVLRALIARGVPPAAAGELGALLLLYVAGEASRTPGGDTREAWQRLADTLTAGRAPR